MIWMTIAEEGSEVDETGRCVIANPGLVSFWLAGCGMRCGVGIWQMWGPLASGIYRNSARCNDESYPRDRPIRAQPPLVCWDSTCPTCRLNPVIPGPQPLDPCRLVDVPSVATEVACFFPPLSPLLLSFTSFETFTLLSNYCLDCGSVKRNSGHLRALALRVLYIASSSVYS
jgi:hypothetical protein